MRPEIGKWYWIKYSKKTSKRGHHGPAKCLGIVTVYNHEDCWRFIIPEEQESPRYGHLFNEKDVKRECSRPPSYRELLSLYETGSKEIKDYLDYLNIRKTLEK